MISLQEVRSLNQDFAKENEAAIKKVEQEIDNEMRENAKGGLRSAQIIIDKKFALVLAERYENAGFTVITRSGYGSNKEFHISW